MGLVFSKEDLSGDVVENPIDRKPELSLCMSLEMQERTLTVGAVSVSNYVVHVLLYSVYYSSRGP
jgi:hypothetical protein